MIIVSLAFCIGVGLTQTSGNFFAAFPPVVGDIFNGNDCCKVYLFDIFVYLRFWCFRKMKRSKKVKMLKES